MALPFLRNRAAFAIIVIIVALPYILLLRNAMGVRVKPDNTTHGRNGSDDDLHQLRALARAGADDVPAAVAVSGNLSTIAEPIPALRGNDDSAAALHVPFVGIASLSRLRIAVVDIFGESDTREGWAGSRTQCLAQSAASLFPYQFDYVQGSRGYGHVAAWLQAEYCAQCDSHHAKKRFVLLIASCTVVHDVSALIRESLALGVAIDRAGVAIAGHVVNAPPVLPFLHEQLTLIDTRKYREFGCPDTGPVLGIFRTSSFPDFSTVGDIKKPRILSRSFSTTRSWFVEGSGSFMTPFVSASLMRDVPVWSVPEALRDPRVRVYGYPMFPDNGKFEQNARSCASSLLCAHLNGRGSAKDVMRELEAAFAQLKFTFSPVRSVGMSGCFDQADIMHWTRYTPASGSAEKPKPSPSSGRCALNPDNKPAYLGTNERPLTVSRLTSGAAFIRESAAAGSIHLMSVVGGMNGLHVVSVLRPTYITFFDYGASQQICVGRLYIEILLQSSSRADFISQLFGRNLLRFLKETGATDLTLDNQAQYLSRPIDNEIVTSLLSPASGLTEFSKQCYELFFVPKLRAPLEFRTFSPYFIFNANPSANAGNFTVNYGCEDSFLESDAAVISVRDHLQASIPIGLADYDLNVLEDFVRHPDSLRSDSIVIQISNADDKIYPYIKNFEGQLAAVNALLQHLPKPSLVFVLSTRGVYSISKEGWHFRKHTM